jgi:uncharacterized membrane protein
MNVYEGEHTDLRVLVGGRARADSNDSSDGWIIGVSVAIPVAVVVVVVAVVVLLAVATVRRRQRMKQFKARLARAQRDDDAL